MENFARLANSDRHLFAPRVSFRALPLLNAKPTTEVEATASCFLEREDCTLVMWYRFLYAPRRMTVTIGRRELLAALGGAAAAVAVRGARAQQTERMRRSRVRREA